MIGKSCFYLSQIKLMAVLRIIIQILVLLIRLCQFAHCQASMIVDQAFVPHLRDLLFDWLGVSQFEKISTHLSPQVK